MSKIAIIDNCFDCPNWRSMSSKMEDFPTCDKTDKIIPNDEKIPEWCPLQDAKDYVIKEK